MRWFWAALVLAGIGAAGAERLTLTWEDSVDVPVAGYRLYFGTNAGSYRFVTNAGLALTQSVVLPHAGRWFLAATAYTSDGVESGFSEEVVWESAPAAPVVAGEAWVRVTPVLEWSTNLVNWCRATGTATWWPATNRAEFFRASGLLIQGVKRVVTP
jgi:hypothetical protein